MELYYTVSNTLRCFKDDLLTDVQYKHTRVQGKIPRICLECLGKLSLVVLNQYITCDMCHSKHDRIFIDDNQGYGLCGIVERTDDLLNWVISCGYGSQYDAFDNHTILKFTNDILPAGIIEGMNLCDKCIEKLIATDTCKCMVII
jgi:hypothetical protein